LSLIDNFSCEAGVIHKGNTVKWISL